MIQFKKQILGNGVKLIHHYDSATRMVALNLLYDVGSKDENPNRTGLAHLMEHLMFTGSLNVPSYDGALQAAGGTSNAWTNPDMTNYYEVLPASNIETGLWAESDRLQSLTLSDESISVQKDVVVEEFKQRYLNEPYGDITHLIHSLAYKVHPYRYPTIGIAPSHIQDVTNEEIKSFYKSHYAPNNLILCISGNITFDNAVRLADKWFGDIAPRDVEPRLYETEPIQTEPRFMHVERSVPQNIIYIAYHMPDRHSRHYATCDLISDILSNGHSARLQQNILSKTKAFTDLDASIEGCNESGLFFVKGRRNDGVTFEQAQELIDAELSKMWIEGVSEHELRKCQNKFHASMLFDNISYQEKAQKLCEYELLGDAAMLNEVVDLYRGINTDDIVTMSEQMFDKNNSCTIWYKAKK